MSTAACGVVGIRHAPPAVVGCTLWGVLRGLHGMKIRKPGLDIPAKYNTETVLGHEVIYGQEMFEPIRFDLAF